MISENIAQNTWGGIIGLKIHTEQKLGGSGSGFRKICLIFLVVF